MEKVDDIAEAPAPRKSNTLLKSILKSTLISGLIVALSATFVLYKPNDSTTTTSCEQITSHLIKDQFLSSITLNPKAELSKTCIDSLLQHKDEVTHLRVEVYSNVEILLSHLKEFPNLRKLELVNVQLKKFDLQMVEENTQLTHLVLDNNLGLSFTGQLSGQMNLTQLSLAHCDLHQVPEAVYNIVSLQELSLHGNDISIAEVHVEKLPNLVSYNGESLKL